MTRARDILIDILRDEGVTHIFGNPGSTEMPLMDALVDAPDITYVLGLQEATAVGMADGWALASGKVGFVNLHAMGGLGNAMGVLVASKASETPLVVTAGQQDTRHLMTEPWLSGDLVALASPVVKWAREVRRGEDVGQALRRAFAIARTPPTGPVFLSLPMDVLDQEVDGPPPPASAPPRLGPSPDARASGRAARCARSGKSVCPARRRSSCEREPRARRLRRKPRFSGARRAAHLARGVSLDPSLLGRASSSRISPGCTSASRTRRRSCWSAGAPSSPIPIARSGRRPTASPSCTSPTTPRRSGASTPPTWRCVGDIGATLAEAALVLRTCGDHARVAARLAELAARRKTADDLLRAKILREPETPLSADAAVLAVLDALPEGALIANDSAATFGDVQALLKTRPGRYFFARGGVLGCNMPASVGAALAISDWVVSLVGDGGAMYSPQALWSAAHYRTRVIFVVFNNRRYGVLQNVARSLGYANAKAGRFVGMETVDPAIDFAALVGLDGDALRQGRTRARRCWRLSPRR